MKAEDNPFPYITLVEGSAPSAPSAGRQREFIDSADHKVKRINSSGTVTTVEGGGGASTSAARATATGATPQSFTSGTEAAITWDTEEFDDATYHDLVTNPSRFTAPAAGRYRMSFGYALASTKVAFFSIKKNATTQLSRAPGISFSGFSTNGQCFGQCHSGPVDLASGDYLEATVLHFNVAGSGSTTRDTGIPCWATFERIT